MKGVVINKYIYMLYISIFTVIYKYIYLVYIVLIYIYKYI